MEPSVLLLLAVLLSFFLLLVRGHAKVHGHLPPGPRPLPLLGNLLQMDRGGLLKCFIQLQKKYGDVFTVHLGPKPVVVLCGTQTIREALVDHAEAFSGRGTIAALQRTMQEYGAPLDPTFLFQCTTANIICSIVFGERFDYTDHQFLHLLELLHQNLTLLSSISNQIFELFSGFLKYFPGTHRQISKNVLEILDFIGHNVEKHRATLDPSTPRDFIDTFLLRMEMEKSNCHTEFHHQNLMMSVLNLFFAGSETTSNTLCYGFLVMLKYPHVIEKVQKEIDQVIGSHRLPTLDDRAKMPYTDAVIHEIQRFCDIAPIGVPHRVTKDTMFRGYLLPKNTEVYPILSTALHDPRYFEQPDTFNPEHFLDANGALKKSEAFLSFSTGKRICLGEGIARNELFLFFTAILQNFSVASPVAPKDIDLTPKETGIGKIAPTYQICFLAR
ncbi:cytochrome P450 2B9-like isoform X2 [Arvicanthis niloticus]|uniref:cytochrome P450 2B9-like isoform X2 n=1 Tax=Arvicanthis niloticus TaxID=61156 RepID=UPI00402BEA23